MTADANASSPKHDNVYMTWTRFNAGGPQPDLLQPVDGRRGNLVRPDADQRFERSDLHRFRMSGPAWTDQGSDPVVGPDGTIYVAFAQREHSGRRHRAAAVREVPGLGGLQQSGELDGADSGSTRSATHARRAEPRPAACSGRKCLPPNGYRMGPRQSSTISVDRNGKLYVDLFRLPERPRALHTARPRRQRRRATTTSSTRSRRTAARPGQLRATSLRASRFGENAQWQPWSEVTKDGSTLWVGYYDRPYGNCESTGCNDITAAAIDNRRDSNHPSYDYTRMTTGSMPNLVPANNPVQAGFLGDYMWVDTDSHSDAHIVWADTRPIRGTARGGHLLREGPR